MYFRCTVGAIFVLYIILLASGDNAIDDNEVKDIYVPSAPQNLSAIRVTSREIQLLWAPPTGFVMKSFLQNRTNKANNQKHQNTDKLSSELIDNENQADAPFVGLTNQDAEEVVPKDNRDEETVNDSGREEYRNYEPSNDWSANVKYSDLLIDQSDSSYRNLRDIWYYPHRHRKRRQESISSVATKRNSKEVVTGTHQALEQPEAVKATKPGPVAPNGTQIAYVLYYEQGFARPDASTVRGIPRSNDVKNIFVFPSDLGIDGYLKGIKNITLWNKTGRMAMVGFNLVKLSPFTPYKIWVRAFYSVSLRPSDTLENLGPTSESLYVLTDVRAPSEPIILDVTCDHLKGVLYVHWRQPVIYDNSLDEYVVSLRKFPEPKPRCVYRLPTNKTDIETTFSMNEVLDNDTRYEVKIYAVTMSVVKLGFLINGSDSPLKEVVTSSCPSVHTFSTWDARSPDARSPDVMTHSSSMVALLAVIPLVLLGVISIAFLYWRCRSRLSKCISAAYSYLEEGGERAVRAPLNSYKKPVVNCSPLRACADPTTTSAEETAAPEDVTWRRPPRMSSPNHPLVTATTFPAHVATLHADGDIGFSKEYEVVVARSAALGHTSHYSHRPENRLKNRYLNITAYDHSRVCVSAGARCGAAGCMGEGRPGNCDYVNANFIDGMLPALDEDRRKYIRRKLERRRRPPRQPSVRPVKPPPNLTDGIESAFLNIEFSGIVEPEDQQAEADSDSDHSDDEELDEVFVDLDGVQTKVKLEWLLWRRRYIATQGPTPATLDAFWKMIWQHRVHTVVMITNLVERGRRKCDMYWPSGGRGSSAEFGGVHVTLLHEDVRQAYTVRHMRIRKQDAGDADGEENVPQWRSLLQYHYTVWPDHGTPRHPLAVLPFVKAASADPETVLVHCSAGVGRTGTYIVLDAQLNQLKLTGTLSPLGFLCRARTQRNHLVQTEEQYVFVHDSLLEHVRSGNTEVEFSKAKEYLVKLLQPITEEELAVLDFINKNKSYSDLTNGFDVNGDTSSLKSQDKDESSVNSDARTVTDVPNGDGSQVSLKTDDLSDRSKSISVKDMNGDSGSQEGKEMNGDETEGVYDLAPRSTDTYSKKMQAYANLSEQEKEEIRRINRVENYALLERMRSLANKHQQYQGPPPVNLLEKQYLLITRSCVEPGPVVRAAHNADKNRLGGILPSDNARVMLVPKPGVEGSDYVNASWVSGRRRLREFAVAQHPISADGGGGGGCGAAELWRLLWDHTAQLVLLLTHPNETQCETFWPTEEETELYVANFKASFVSKDIFVAHRKSERKSPVPATEPETNGYRRQESSDCADDERLIPDNASPISDTEPAYRFDRTELRLERLSTGTRDLSARKSIANGDLFSSLSESRRSGPKSPKSPSKMSLKNFKLSSPTRFKFPDWGSKGAGSPPEMAPPPPPVVPSLSVEDEAELRRPCYAFEKVESVPEDVSSDRVIEVINVSVHSLQDDYQLSVKFIRCIGWLEGESTAYTPGKPEDNPYINAIMEANTDEEREEAVDRLTEPYKHSFGLVEFIAGCQMEYKNGPVVVVDKYGGWRAMSFCTLSAACGGARNPAVADPAAEFRSASDDAADVYCWAALAAHARCPSPHRGGPAPHSHRALLANYAALARYNPHIRFLKSPKQD